MEPISTRLFNGQKYFLLNTYPDKPLAVAFAYRYKQESSHRRLARVTQLGKEWAVWVRVVRTHS